MTMKPQTITHRTTRSECTICGIPMRRTWTDDLTDSTWHAVDGTTRGIAADAPVGAPPSTPELLELLASRGDMHSYSVAHVRYQMGHFELP